MPPLFPGRGPRGQVFVRGVEDVALHPDPRQVRPQLANLDLLGGQLRSAPVGRQLACLVSLDPVRQRLLDHAQGSRHFRNTLPGLNQTYRFQLELVGVNLPRYSLHLRSFAIFSERYMRYVFRGQGQ